MQSWNREFPDSATEIRNEFTDLDTDSVQVLQTGIDIRTISPPNRHLRGRALVLQTQNQSLESPEDVDEAKEVFEKSLDESG